MRIDEPKAYLAIQLLCEGSGVRSIERITGLNRRTVLSLLRLAGERCTALLDEKVRNVKAEQIQADELVCYVNCRQQKTTPDDTERGNFHTFLSIDRDSKLIINWLVSKHTREAAESFLYDLRERVQPGFQLSTDGWRAYSGGYLEGSGAVVRVFGNSIKYATEIKVYAKVPDRERRMIAQSSIPLFLPRRRVMKIRKEPIIGNPDMDMATTSHCERTNLSVRLFTRRYTRCTMGFSKCVENLRHSVALFVGWFNFVKVHGAHNKSPAQMAGLATRPWTIAELIAGGTAD